LRGQKQRKKFIIFFCVFARFVIIFYIFGEPLFHFAFPQSTFRVFSFPEKEKNARKADFAEPHTR